MEIRYTSAAQWADARDGVIPAPYALEAGESITDRYLEPVVFHNENGPDIGVTTCGVIVRDGLYFKDMDNSGELAPYKDWRLSPEERAKDMVAHLRLDQQAGLVLNTLFNTPVAPTRAEAAGADYLGCGAVFGSTTKTNVTQLPIETLKAICEAVTIPVVAIGGVNNDNLPLLAGSGIAGVAVVSGLFRPTDKTAAVRHFLDQLRKI